MGNTGTFNLGAQVKKTGNVAVAPVPTQVTVPLNGNTHTPHSTNLNIFTHEQCEQTWSDRHLQILELNNTWQGHGWPNSKQVYEYLVQKITGKKKKIPYF